MGGICSTNGSDECTQSFVLETLKEKRGIKENNNHKISYRNRVEW
jgi:hypothetical protein